MNNRLPKITEAIYEVFENTSGYDLTEFEGDTTFFEMGFGFVSADANCDRSEERVRC